MVSIVLYPSDDNMFQTDSPNFNHGATADIGIGEEDFTSTIYRAAIRFDFSTIPIGSIINNATFQITCYRDASNKTATINLYKATSAWTEETVTWNTQPSYDGSGTIGSFSIANGFTGNKTTTITTSLVSGWYKGTINNYGFLLKTSTENDDHFGFRSKEYTTESQRPQLTINYDPPGGAFIFHML